MRKIVVEVPKNKCWEERVNWDDADKRCSLLYKVGKFSYSCIHRTAFVTQDFVHRLKPTKPCQEVELKNNATT